MSRLLIEGFEIKNSVETLSHNGSPMSLLLNSGAWDDYYFNVNINPVTGSEGLTGDYYNGPGVNTVAYYGEQVSSSRKTFSSGVRTVFSHFRLWHKNNGTLDQDLHFKISYLFGLNWEIPRVNFEIIYNVDAKTLSINESVNLYDYSGTPVWTTPIFFDNSRIEIKVSLVDGYKPIVDIKFNGIQVVSNHVFSEAISVTTSSSRIIGFLLCNGGVLSEDVASIPLEVTRMPFINQDPFPIDDLVLDDSDWIGNSSIIKLRPSGAGTYSDLSPSVAGSSQYSLINDDDESTFITSNTVLAKSTFQMADLPETTVSLKSFYFSARALSPGIPCARYGQLVIIFKGQEFFLQSTELTTEYMSVASPLAELNPITFAPLEVSDFNTIQAGFRVTSS